MKRSIEVGFDEVLACVRHEYGIPASAAFSEEAEGYKFWWDEERRSPPTPPPQPAPPAPIASAAVPVEQEKRTIIAPQQFAPPANRPGAPERFARSVDLETRATAPGQGTARVNTNVLNITGGSE